MITINNCFVKDEETDVIGLVCEVLEEDIDVSWEDKPILPSGIYLPSKDEMLYTNLKNYSLGKDKNEI